MIEKLITILDREYKSDSQRVERLDKQKMCKTIHEKPRVKINTT